MSRPGSDRRAAGRRSFITDPGGALVGPWQAGNHHSAGGTMICGATQPAPSDAGPHWHVWFGSDDVEATAQLVPGLGGEVTVEPTASPGGMYASFRDPAEAVFSVITPQSG